MAKCFLTEEKDFINILVSFRKHKCFQFAHNSRMISEKTTVNRVNIIAPEKLTFSLSPRGSPKKNRLGLLRRGVKTAVDDCRLLSS